MDIHESANNLSVTLMEVSEGGCNSTSFDDLPIELVIYILSRLPVKSILLTVCVCKRWYSIIKTPAFISAQLSRSTSDPSNKYFLLALKSSPPDSDFYLVSHDKFLSVDAKIKIPFETVSKSVDIVGSCNGLVCISTDSLSGCRHSGDLYLVNPIIQKYKKLRAEDSCYADLLIGEINCNIVMGFGYSDVDNDYKVVRNLSGSGAIGPSKIWAKAEVYSLKSGKWKVINDPAYACMIDFYPHFVDGCLYYLPYFDEDDNRYLQCFDLNDEVFRKIEMPANLIDLSPSYVYGIVQVNGSLAFLVNNFSVSTPTGDQLYIFVMGKDNPGQVHWKELYLETIKDEVTLSYYRLRFSISGRLEVEEWHEIDDDEERDKYPNDGKGSLGALNLDNLKAIEALIFYSEKPYTIDTSFNASLVSFPD